MPRMRGVSHCSEARSHPLTRRRVTDRGDGSTVRWNLPPRAASIVHVPDMRASPLQSPRHAALMPSRHTQSMPPPNRPDRRRALAASTAWFVGPLWPMHAVLARVLGDDPDPAITATAERVVAGLGTTRERAVALHDHVRDAVRFGFTARFHAMSASDVLATAVGYGCTKATLFVALLRAAGIEARQRFVELDAAVWRGLLDLGTPCVDHCLTEVRVGGAWLPTDSYAVDQRLFRAAQAALRAEGRRRGYGIDAAGTCAWDGRGPAYAQWLPDGTQLPLRQWGVHADVAAFYEATPAAWNRGTNSLRVVFPLAALIAQRTADALREHGATAVRGRARRA